MTVVQHATLPAKPPVQVLQGEREAKTKLVPSQSMVGSTLSSQPILTSLRRRNLQSRPKPPNSLRRQAAAIQKNRPMHLQQNPLVLPNVLPLNLPAPLPVLPCLWGQPLRETIKLAKSPSRQPRCGSPMECKLVASLPTTNLREFYSRAGHRTLQRRTSNGTSGLMARFTLSL